MGGSGWKRREALAGAIGLIWPGGVNAEENLPAPPETPVPDPPLSLDELVTLDLSEDGERRMGVSVAVEGCGPFLFLVDTASDHSVLSSELAATLRLPPAGFVRVQGLAGGQLNPRGFVRRLEVGGRKLDNVALPLLPRRHLGALGIVGLDALSRQSIGIDFAKRTMQVRRSRGFSEEAGAIVVQGKSHFGHLILVDSTVKQTPIYVVLDTGAEDTMGNATLRTLLFNRRVAQAEPDSRRMVELVSVTGQSLMGEADEMPELKLGKISLSQVPMVYAELDTFRMFDLTDKPSLMLGMSTLRSFSNVYIDFPRREVAFTLPSGQSTTA